MLSDSDDSVISITIWRAPILWQTMQSYLYYRVYPKDRPHIKTLVRTQFTFAEIDLMTLPY